MTIERDLNDTKQKVEKIYRHVRDNGKLIKSGSVDTYSYCGIEASMFDEGYSNRIKTDTLNIFSGEAMYRDPATGRFIPGFDLNEGELAELNVILEEFGIMA